MARLTYMDVLDSIPVPEEHRGDYHTMLIYKMGVLAALVARYANQDMVIRQELEARRRLAGSGDSVRTVRRGV